ncbi:MAG: transposase [Bacteroidetes bacterium]|nr:transposase [Bacteroidota bacterium]
MAAILKEFDNGKSVEDISREHSVSRATFYKWQKGYGGMEASELKRVKGIGRGKCSFKAHVCNLAMELDVAKIHY